STRFGPWLKAGQTGSRPMRRRERTLATVELECALAHSHEGRRVTPWVERLVLALALMQAFPSGALAQLGLPRSFVPQAVRVHLYTWHDRGDFNNANPGLALRWNGGLVAGGFYNSVDRPSWYGGLVLPVFESHALRLELMTGAITGYSETSPVDLVAVPSLGWHLSPRSTVDVVFMPRFVIPANAVHVMFEQRLGSSGRHSDITTNQSEARR